jgi:hypothetical protein
MGIEDEFKEVEPAAVAAVPNAAQVSGGVPVPPVSLLQVMSADDWEAFTEEWLSYHNQRGSYASIRRYSGAGDLGLDVVAFTAEEGFSSPWDSYQCKHYDHPLQPGDILSEIAKIIYHSFQRTPPFNQACRVPRRHVFVAPKGAGITVGRLLKDPKRLKAEVMAKWDSHCVPKLGRGIHAPLEAELLHYFDSFDFSIFDDRSGAELIDEHSKTVYHSSRFGGGLPPRCPAEPPPEEPVAIESLYLKKLFDAYSDHVGVQGFAAESLDSYPDLKSHYNRQRVLFYSAESLRNFARDRTPPRTFDSLQEDIYHGVIDVCESAHADSLARLRSTVTAAAQTDVSGNGLSSVTSVRDKQGICHQLANDDRLTWKNKND